MFIKRAKGQGEKMNETDGNCYCTHVIDSEIFKKDGETFHSICGGKNPKLKVKKKKDGKTKK